MKIKVKKVVQIDALRAALKPFADYYDLLAARTTPKRLDRALKCPIAYEGRYDGPTGHDCRVAKEVLESTEV